ncbi:hypothetical protein I7I51_02647 [Histoplasma capsulatum]|uniref:Uncharacterized protein n=1 Tax=Ajellomyces capsulatus TaxID=5037 RepID=A0A8A1ME56_AJECA|nr:hypothetical protein I7I51_02647 [Histoplasma capsulatum]
MALFTGFLGPEAKIHRAELEKQLLRGSVKYGLDAAGNRRYVGLDGLTRLLLESIGLEANHDLATWRISTSKFFKPLQKQIYIIPIRIISGEPCVIQGEIKSLLVPGQYVRLEDGIDIQPELEPELECVFASFESPKELTPCPTTNPHNSASY